MLILQFVDKWQSWIFCQTILCSTCFNFCTKLYGEWWPPLPNICLGGAETPSPLRLPYLLRLPAPWNPQLSWDPLPPWDPLAPWGPPLPWVTLTPWGPLPPRPPNPLRPLPNTLCPTTKWPMLITVLFQNYYLLGLRIEWSNQPQCLINSQLTTSKSKCYLFFSLKSVCVQSISIVKNHVVVQWVTAAVKQQK